MPDTKSTPALSLDPKRSSLVGQEAEAQTGLDRVQELRDNPDTSADDGHKQSSAAAIESGPLTSAPDEQQEGENGGEGGSPAAPDSAPSPSSPPLTPSSGLGAKMPTGVSPRSLRLPSRPDISATGGPEGGESGDDGDVVAAPSLDVDNATFVDTIFPEVPEGAEPAICSKPGDPNAGGWTARVARDVNVQCPAGHNNYVNCSSFSPDGDGNIKARKESFAAYHVLVLDDVGTKVEAGLLSGLEPTWKIETSPGNFQLGVRFLAPITDPKQVEALQGAIVAAGLSDPGSVGVARWVRLPAAINGKAKFAGADGTPFQCKLIAWNPATAYTPEQLIDTLQLDMSVTARPSTKARSSADSADRHADDVYVPKPSHNAVLAAFRDRGWYKSVISPGKHDVTCPWVEEHTDALDTGAAYWEPDDAHPTGGFRCLHAHGDRYHIGDVLKVLDVDPEQARDKPRIRLLAGEINRVIAAAEKVLASRGGFYQSGGMIVSVRTDPVSGDLSIMPISPQVLTTELAAAADWEKYDGRKNAWVRCDPTPRHIDLLYKAEAYAHLPALTGLARQPHFRESDGQLVMQPGYDPVSKRFAAFDPGEFVIPEPTREAALAALQLLRDSISEFRFASPVDEAAALSAIFTAVVRPALEVAPAFSTTAPSMGSGKSYLNGLIGAFAGPGGSLKTSYPKTSEEATKSMLSLLIRAPAVIEFDDMDTDWLPHGVINRMMTSRAITDRLLGFSKMVTVSTQSLVLGSGNNIEPARDMRRRVISIRLDARSDSPATLTYTGDPVAAVRAERGRYVAAVLTIMLAWQRAGRPRAQVPNVASFGGAWSDFCRHPLLWLGLADPATALIEQIRSDPDAEVLGHLLGAWHERYGHRPVTVRQVLKDAFNGRECPLKEALMDLPIVGRDEISPSKLGWYIKKNLNRIVGGLEFRRGPETERKTWSVAAIGSSMPASPPLPPSSAPFAKDVEEGGEDAF